MVLGIPEINKSHCAILHGFYQTLFKSFVSFGSFAFHLCTMKSYEDDELPDEGVGTSGLDFSDD